MRICLSFTTSERTRLPYFALRLRTSSMLCSTCTSLSGLTEAGLKLVKRYGLPPRYDKHWKQRNRTFVLTSKHPRLPPDRDLKRQLRWRRSALAIACLKFFWCKEGVTVKVVESVSGSKDKRQDGDDGLFEHGWPDTYHFSCFIHTPLWWTHYELRRHQDNDCHRLELPSLMREYFTKV